MDDDAYLHTCTLPKMWDIFRVCIMIIIFFSDSKSGPEKMKIQMKFLKQGKPVYTVEPRLSGFLYYPDFSIIQTNCFSPEMLLFSYYVIHILDYPDSRLSGHFSVVPTCPDNRGSTVYAW